MSQRRWMVASLVVGLSAVACGEGRESAAPGGQAAATAAVINGHATTAASSEEYLADFRRLARVAWPKNRMLTVVCHGHSVPAGYGKTPEVRSLDAYPNLLRVALAGHYPNATINVIVTAIGGEDARVGAARFERDVLSLRPDVICIDYSLNDRRIGLPAAREAWTTMIAAAKARHVPVLCFTPTPDQAARPDRPADLLRQHAAQVRAIAAEQGVGLVDSAAAFDRAIAAGIALPDLMAQSNHPNRKGHELVAGELVRWFGVTGE